MDDHSNIPVSKKYFLEPGFIYVPTKPMLISTVLGSSVSVCIYDRKKKIGGMNHFQYPLMTDQTKTTSRYGNVATLVLIKMMAKECGGKKYLEAQIFGGACNPVPDPMIDGHNIGAENIKIARKILYEHHIAIVSEDTGGQKGRKIVFNTYNNEIGVFRVDKLRSGDWYPYHQDR